VVLALGSELVVALAGLGVLGLFFLLGRLRLARRAGQKAKRRDIPPDSISAAASRFLRVQGAYDRLCFTAALLDLETHGAIRIDRAGQHLVLHSETPPAGVPGPEGDLLRALFLKTDSVTLDRPRDAVKQADAALNAGLERDYRASHLPSGGLAIAILLGLGLVILAAVLVLARDNLDYLAASGGAAAGMLVALGLGRLAARKLDMTASLTYLQLGGSVILMVAVAWFIRFVHLEGGNIVLPFALAGIFWLLYHADQLAAPTRQGRAALGQIEGYLEHLKQGDDPLGSAERLFLAGLPYAVAAGIEKSWVERQDIARAVTESSYDLSSTARLDEAVRSALA